MCISPLPEEILANLNKFQYKCTSESIIYNKFLSPCLNKVELYVPRKLAPNLITLFSLMFNILAAVISYYDGGFDFSKELSRLTCFVIGFFQLMYLLLDNIDGKHARRTGNTSPFGMLMDHGCDIFTNIFTCFNLSKLLLVGNDDFYSFSIFFGLMLGFYMMSYEGYKLGEMHFPKIDGSVEGNIAVVVMGVIFAIIGQGVLKIELSGLLKLTVGKLLGMFILLGGFSAVFNLYLHTFKKKGLKETLKIPLDNIPFYSSIIIPIIYIEFNLTFYQTNTWIVLSNSCLIFARVTIDILVKMSTMDVLKCNIMYVFANIIYVGSFILFTSDFIRYYVLLFLFLVQSTELAVFIFFRAREITKYLGIRIFCVKEVTAA